MSLFSRKTLSKALSISLCTSSGWHFSSALQMKPNLRSFRFPIPHSVSQLLLDVADANSKKEINDSVLRDVKNTTSMCLGEPQSNSETETARRVILRNALEKKLGGPDEAKKYLADLQKAKEDLDEGMSLARRVADFRDEVVDGQGRLNFSIAFDRTRDFSAGTARISVGVDYLKTAIEGLRNIQERIRAAFKQQAGEFDQQLNEATVAKLEMEEMLVSFRKLQRVGDIDREVEKIEQTLRPIIVAWEKSLPEIRRRRDVGIASGLVIKQEKALEKLRVQFHSVLLASSARNPLTARQAPLVPVQLWGLRDKIENLLSQTQQLRA